MSKWDGKFNGTYETSKYAGRTLEEEILDAGRGVIAYAGPNGELIRITDKKIDVWEPGDGEGHYVHHFYSTPDDYGKAPDDRHDK